MFIGRATPYNRTNATDTFAANASRLPSDCLPRVDPLTDVGRQLAHIQTRSVGALLNPSGFIDRVAFAANAAAGSVDADVPPARPLSSIARLSLAESQAALNAATGGASSSAAGGGAGGAGGRVGGGGRAPGATAAASAAAAASSGRRSGGFSEGAVEVFLAGIGVDLREQTRQMQHVGAMRPSSSYSLMAGSPALGALDSAAQQQQQPGSGELGALLQPAAGELDQFVKNRRQESLGQAILDVSRAMSSREMLALRAGGGAGGGSSVMRAPSFDTAAGLLLHGGAANLLGTPRAAPLSGALRSIGGGGGAISATPGGGAVVNTPESARMHSNVQESIERANRFASVVASFPAGEWLARFVTVANKSVDDVSSAANAALLVAGGNNASASIERALDLADVWNNVRRMLFNVPLASNNNSSGGGNPQQQQHHLLHPSLVAVAGSRSSLEHTFFSSLLAQIGFNQSGIKASNIDPAQLPDAINRFCSLGRTSSALLRETSVWTKLFVAMRSGQWRAAVNICAASKDAAVSGSVQSALRDDPRGNGPSAAAAGAMGAFEFDDNNVFGGTVTRLPVAQHASLEELRKLYENEATAKDPFRACVLFLLLRGRLGARRAAQQPGSMATTQEEESNTVKELDDIIKKVSQSIEDVLWIRLSLVECVSLATTTTAAAAAAAADVPALPGAAVGAMTTNDSDDRTAAARAAVAAAKTHGGPAMFPFHALHDVQASIQAENPATLANTVFEGNKQRLANFYFHALLPATACRALLTPSSTLSCADATAGASSIDAVHFCIVFQQRGLLPSANKFNTSSSSSSSFGGNMNNNNSTEARMHLESALRSFVCSYVTIRASGPARCDSPLLHVAFSYFRAVGMESAFVNLCASDEIFAARVFSPLVPTGGPGAGAAANNNNNNQLQLLAEAATGEHTLSTAASNIELLKLLDRVGEQAMLNSKTTLCAQVSLIQYANAAQLARRSQHRNDTTVEALCKDAVTRTYLSLTPALQSAVLRAVSARCALVQPNAEFVVDGPGGANMRSSDTVAAAATVAVPIDLVQAARTVRAVVEAVGPLSVHQATGGQLNNLMLRFAATLSIVDLLAAFDDRDDAAVARTFFSISYVPTTPAQIEACCQRLNTAGESLIVLISRVYLLTQYSLNRQRRCMLQGQRSSNNNNNNNNNGEDVSLSKVEAQAELLEQWFDSWSQRCKAAIAGTIKA